MEAATYQAVLCERVGNDGCLALDEMIIARQANLLTVERFEQRLAEKFAEAFAQHRAEMRADMAERTTEVLKWAMLFWVGQAAAVAGIVAVFR